MTGTARDQQELNSGSAASVLRHLYAPIEPELAEVERLLKAEMTSEFAYVNELVRYGCLLGGKRLRPALLLLVGTAAGQLQRAHITLGAVVEMIHTATLVHDDVLDEADTRRHLATVNARWDNKASVLLGDFLFTHAFYLASTLESTWACRQIGRATNIVCEGELRQKGCRGDFSLSEQQYLEIIAAKTAELCACSCKLGAYYAGCGQPVVEAMTSFGREVGVAFQIIDDVLDLLGDERTTGKSLGTDLEQQKPTLPIIRTLQTAGRAERAKLLDWLPNGTPVQRADLLPILERCGAFDYTYQIAREHIHRAQRQLMVLPETPAREHLQELAGFVLARMQ